MSNISYIRKIIEKIKEIGTLKIYEPDTPIINQGEMGDSIYFLIEGVVKVIIFTEEGRELILNKLRSINFFGEIGIFENCPRTATIESETVCKVVEVNKDKFMQFIKDENETFFMLLLEMAKRIREANRKIYILSLSKARDRIQCYLGDIMVSKMDTKIFLPIHDTIAKEVGLTRETVSKILGDMKKEGLISNTHGKVEVNHSILFCSQNC